MAVSIPKAIHVKNWPELIRQEAKFKPEEQWAFRGQDTPLFPETSLYRHVKSIDKTELDIAPLLEASVIRDFARSYHLKGGHAPPEKGRTLEWIAMMQHYGTPTRLIDFTYSFFIAAFFALEKADKGAVVWAISTKTLREAAEKQFGIDERRKQLLTAYQNMRDGEPFRDLYMHMPPIRFAYMANPIRMNKRLSIQQGVFIAPGDVSKSFKQNIRQTLGLNAFVKITIDPFCKTEILRKLYSMGINNGTLFPGLEGYARSLREKSMILRDLLSDDLSKEIQQLAYL